MGSMGCAVRKLFVCFGIFLKLKLFYALKVCDHLLLQDGDGDNDDDRHASLMGHVFLLADDSDNDGDR